ncbi:GntP family permease [Streptomyces reniochalinae]|uniref:Gluconate permease n=1 Tax=Streptomyces reniochalinae TaxID=2250578 RepID=A0A367EB63_9ACTN|nr:SLC13 family permease [Streptomyces reniochalinae]RCG15308.1 gluconate permease [Streptomyces reniochalinae]
MDNPAPLVHTAIAIAAVVVLILKAKVNPALALVLGAVYLGLAGGLGAERTLKTVNKGFGDLMAEVGLLIVLGVLLGTLLSALGAIDKLVTLLLRTLGPKRLPYSFAITMGTVLQSIFADVLLVMTAPLARSLGTRIGPGGLARMAAAMALGVEVGIALSVPGIGALALAGLLDIPLGIMLLYGFPLAAVTILLTLLLFSALVKRGFWNPDRDESAVAEGEAVVEGGAAVEGGAGFHDGAVAHDGAAARGDATAHGGAGMSGDAAVGEGGAGHAGAGVGDAVAADGDAGTARGDGTAPPLGLSLTPLLLALVLIATGAFAQVAGWDSPVVGFLGDPVVGLLTGLILACLVARRRLPAGAVGEAFGQGFRTSGQILVLTGVGGSLAAVVEAVGLGDLIKDSFSAGTWAPLALVWLIAAVLHMAIGSVTTSAITAAGILAPVAPSLDVQPVLIALAAGAGSLFAIHATSNTFWLLQTLLGQTTRGTLKTVTLTVSGASVIALGLIQTVSLVM